MAMLACCTSRGAQIDPMRTTQTLAKRRLQIPTYPQPPSKMQPHNPRPSSNSELSTTKNSRSKIPTPRPEHPKPGKPPRGPTPGFRGAELPAVCEGSGLRSPGSSQSLTGKVRVQELGFRGLGCFSGLRLRVLGLGFRLRVSQS